MAVGDETNRSAVWSDTGLFDEQATNKAMIAIMLIEFVLEYILNTSA
jgi:hypothetical protein